jgi:hypothetical protein
MLGMNYLVAFSNWRPCYDERIAPEMGLKVEFGLNSIGMINVPQYAADPYRVISISKIPPEIKPIAETWEEVPYPYVSKCSGLNYWSKSWPTRRDARARASSRSKFGIAILPVVVLSFFFLNPALMRRSYQTSGPPLRKASASARLV